MKKIQMGIILIVVLMLVGCSKVETHGKVNKLNKLEEKEETSQVTDIKQLDEDNSSLYNMETYDDETHKNIKYDKLSFEFDTDFNPYHIISVIDNDNKKTFKCEIDKGKELPQSNINITIETIEKEDFSNEESIKSYLIERFPDYKRIQIYNNVNDESRITDLYEIVKNEGINYIVCYGDTCYFIESDYPYLSNLLFKDYQNVNYELNNNMIEWNKSLIANVKGNISYDDNKGKYEIIQHKDNQKYFSELSYDDEKYTYNFILKNENDENLLELTTHSSNIREVVKFLDLNRDGYVDIQFLEQEGTLNNIYGLYIWDDSVKKFVKVKYDEPISDFEIHEGYLLIWGKNDSESEDVEKLIWKGNSLIKESQIDIKKESNSTSKNHSESLMNNTYEIYKQGEISLKELKLIKEETYKEIVKLCEDIDFNGDFKPIDLKENLFYREQYLKRLKEEAYIDKLEEEGYYELAEYSPENMDKYKYYFFDMNGDKIPELIVFGGIKYMPIFSFDIETNKVELIDIEKAESYFLGNNKIGDWYGGTGLTYEFYELDENGNKNSKVFFHSEGYFNNDTQEENAVYMVGFAEGSEKCEYYKELAKQMGEQLYEENYTYFMRISKEQYDKLTKEYFTSKKLSEEKIKDVTYTFEELFGDINK